MFYFNIICVRLKHLFLNLFALAKGFYKSPLVFLNIQHVNDSLLGIKYTKAAFIRGYGLESAFLSRRIEDEKKSDYYKYKD